MSPAETGGRTPGRAAAGFALAIGVVATFGLPRAVGAAAAAGATGAGTPVARRSRMHTPVAAPLEADQGHTRPVRALAYTPGGHLLLTAGADGVIGTWDGTHGGWLRQSRAVNRPWPVRSLSVAPTGAWLTAGGGDRQRVFRVGSDRDRLDIEAAAGVLAVRFLPGKKVISYSTSGEIVLRHAASGTVIRRAVIPRSDVRVAALSPDGSRLALADEQGVRLYDTATGERLPRFRPPHRRRVTALAFHPDGEKLATAAEDGYLRVYEVATQAKRRAFRGHALPVRSLAFSPDGKWLASGAEARGKKHRGAVGIEDGVAIWDGAGALRARRSPGFDVLALAFSPGGKALAYAGRDRRPHLWTPMREAPTR